MSRKYIDPDAGSLVRYLRAEAARKDQDPRVDVLVDVGSILLHGSPLKIGENMILDRLEVEDPKYTMFVVHNEGEVVFDAIVSEQAVELGKFTPGPWQSAVSAVSEILRTHPAMAVV